MVGGVKGIMIKSRVDINNINAMIREIDGLQMIIVYGKKIKTCSYGEYGSHELMVSVKALVAERKTQLIHTLHEKYGITYTATT